MIIALTYEGKPFGSPMNDLSGEALLRFLEMEMKLGRTVHITPEKRLLALRRLIMAQKIISEVSGSRTSWRN